MSKNLIISLLSTTTEKALRGKEDTANIRRPSLIAEKRERKRETWDNKETSQKRNRQ